MKILVAYDESPGAEEALRTAQRAATPSGALVLLHLINPYIDAADIDAPTRTEAVASLHARLDARLSERATSIEGPSVEAIVVEANRGEDLAACIDRLATAHEVDAIAIASRRAVGLRGLALGSVTQELLRIAAHPVLVVRA